MKITKTVSQYSQWLGLLIIIIGISIIGVKVIGVGGDKLYVLPNSYVCTHISNMNNKVYFECQTYSGIDTLH